MTAVLANMVEAALAGGLLAVSEPEEVNGEMRGEQKVTASHRDRVAIVYIGSQR
jgi:hypothetical protein